MLLTLAHKKLHTVPWKPWKNCAPALSGADEPSHTAVYPDGLDKSLLIARQIASALRPRGSSLSCDSARLERLLDTAQKHAWHSESLRDLRQICGAKLSGHELANVLVFVRCGTLRSIRWPLQFALAIAT